jgi:hypothetical protein
MGELLSRRALYDLVWSEPLKTLCTRFSISDVALRKTCQRAMIPTPERGYWARKQAGKKTWIVPLPERPPAMEDEVEVGGGHGYGYHYRNWTDEELLGPLPDPPVFDTTLESVRERIVKTIGKVTVAREVTSWHPAVERLLKNDDRLREKAVTSTYVFESDKPQFESPSARRKLRILNALFFTTNKFHARPRPDRDAVRSYLSIYDQHLWIKLAPSKGKNVDEKLSLSIVAGYGSDRELASWSDGEEGRIEKRLGEVAIEIVYRTEISYREGVERRFEWRKERKAQLEEERRQQKLAAERAERERIAKLQRERIEKLLGQAAAFEQARTIRQYVESIRGAMAESLEVPAERLDAWTAWAKAEADRIDPSLNGRFLECLDAMEQGQAAGGS